MLNQVSFVIVQALVSLKRNIWLTIASILTVMTALILLGGSVFFLANTSNLATSFESQIEIAVFINDNQNREQVIDLRNQIQVMAGVDTVELTAKEDAIIEFQESMGSSSLLEDLGGINPFPDKITVKATDARLVEGIANQIAEINGVDKVRYGQGILEKLIQFTDWLRWIGIAVVAAFAFASFLLITLNIKTNVNSRENEIQIMRLVGASNGLIKWPFFIEGLLLGFIGGIISIGIVGIGYNWLLQYIITTLAFLPVVADQMFMISVFALMLIGGMIMGVLASVFAVRKFLK
ncbi:MAG: cell division protein [Gracilibacter sp. BRH_c7a]|nr:MAG: cell division protein [Gracilibacter sp. BRH_c7a]